MTLPPDSPARENAASKIALAPDGSSFAYLGITDGIRLGRTSVQVKAPNSNICFEKVI